MNVPDALQTFAPAIARVLARHPDLIPAVVQRGRPDRAAMLAETHAAADAALAERDADAMKTALRRLKYRVVGALILDDLDAGPALVDEVGATLADLADALLDGALRFTRGVIEAQKGPIEGLAPDADLVSIAMGKHGARELNYSSDIDIVYVARSLPGESRVLVDRLSRRADRQLSEPTADGFCFRVDLNLRPEGRTGPPTSTLAAAENYFLTYGRTWERAAWLKARPAAGDLSLGNELLSAIEPFRFRRHLDFGTLEDLAIMRDRIAASARRDALQRDLKRGPGGIREIEFLVQATQLAWCGRDLSLRVLSTVPALRALDARGVLPSDLRVEELIADYRFLRAVEHRIQWELEAQTQTLPNHADEASWDRLARAMGNAQTGQFRDELSEVRGRVEAAWSLVFTQDPDHEALHLVDPFATVDERTQELEALGFQDPTEAAGRIQRLAEPDARQRMRASTWRHFERLVPRLATLAAQSSDPDAALARLERFVGRVGARGAPYELLHENPSAMEPLIRLFFEHRAFTAEASERTALVLAWYALGIWASCLSNLATRGFYSFDDVRTPVRVGVWMVLLNLGLNLALVSPMGEAGLALATALTHVLNALLLLWILHRNLRAAHGAGLGVDALRRDTIKVVVLSAAMGAVVLLALRLLASLGMATQLAVAVAAGVACYGLLSWKLAPDLLRKLVSPAPVD